MAQREGGRERACYWTTVTIATPITVTIATLITATIATPITNGNQEVADSERAQAQEDMLPLHIHQTRQGEKEREGGRVGEKSWVGGGITEHWRKENLAPQHCNELNFHRQ